MVEIGNALVTGLQEIGGPKYAHATHCFALICKDWSSIDCESRFQILFP